jgi:hypothetical protein
MGFTNNTSENLSTDLQTAFGALNQINRKEILAELTALSLIKYCYYFYA